MIHIWNVRKTTFVLIFTDYLLNCDFVWNKEMNVAMSCFGRGDGGWEVSEPPRLRTPHLLESGSPTRSLEISPCLTCLSSHYLGTNQTQVSHFTPWNSLRHTLPLPQCIYHSSSKVNWEKLLHSPFLELTACCILIPFPSLPSATIRTSHTPTAFPVRFPCFATATLPSHCIFCHCQVLVVLVK